MGLSWLLLELPLQLIDLSLQLLSLFAHLFEVVPLELSADFVVLNAGYKSHNGADKVERRSDGQLEPRGDHVADDASKTRRDLSLLSATRHRDSFPESCHCGLSLLRRRLALRLRLVVG